MSSWFPGKLSDMWKGQARSKQPSLPSRLLHVLWVQSSVTTALRLLERQLQSIDHPSSRSNISFCSAFKPENDSRPHHNRGGNEGQPYCTSVQHDFESLACGCQRRYSFMQIKSPNLTLSAVVSCAVWLSISTVTMLALRDYASANH